MSLEQVEAFLKLYPVFCESVTYCGCTITVLQLLKVQPQFFDYKSLYDSDYLLVADPVSAAFALLFLSQEQAQYLSGKFLIPTSCHVFGRMLIEEFQMCKYGAFLSLDAVKDSEKYVEFVETDEQKELFHEDGILILHARSNCSLTYYYDLRDESSYFTMGKKSGFIPSEGLLERYRNLKVMPDFGIWTILNHDQSIKSSKVVVVSPVAQKIFKLASVFCRNNSTPDEVKVPLDDLVVLDFPTAECSRIIGLNPLCVSKPLALSGFTEAPTNEQTYATEAPLEPYYRTNNCTLIGGDIKTMRLFIDSFLSDGPQVEIMHGCTSLSYGTSINCIASRPTSLVMGDALQFFRSMLRHCLHEFEIHSSGHHIYIHRLKADVFFMPEPGDVKAVVKANNMRSIVEVVKLFSD